MRAPWIVSVIVVILCTSGSTYVDAVTPRSCQGSPGTTAPCDRCSLQGLLEYLDEHGMQLHNVVFENFLVEVVPATQMLNESKTRLGFLATKDLKKGDVVLTGKLDSGVLSTSSAKSGLLESVLQAMPQMTNFEIMVLHLLAESVNVTSQFWPYLCTIPEVLMTPMHWDKEKLDKNKPMQAEVYNARMLVREDWNSIMPYIFKNFPNEFPKETFNLKNFIWASNVLSSRSFDWKDAQEADYALIPVLDLIGRNNDDMAVNFNQTDNTFQVVLKVDTKKGTELVFDHDSNVRAIQPQYQPRDIASALENKECDFDRLVEWMRAQGSVIRNITLAEYLMEHSDCWECTDASRRGLMALENFEDDDEILGANVHEVGLNKLTAQKTGVKPILDANPQLRSSQQLVLMLLYEFFNPDSFWKIYFPCLPGSIPALPIFWEHNAIEQQSHIAHKDISIARSDQRANWNDLGPIVLLEFSHLMPPEILNLKNFIWASTIVQTRSWALTNRKTNETMEVMIPVLDMINHKVTAKTASSTINDDGSMSLSVHAKGTVSKGQEIFISYGSKAKSKMLMNYGFHTMPSFQEDGKDDATNNNNNNNNKPEAGKDEL